MKRLGNKFNSKKVIEEMFNTIMLYLKGTGSLANMTERFRQYACWGAHAFRYIVAEERYCYGIQFNVSGLLHKGRVRIYYNEGTDYFDVELIKARKEELVWGCADIDCEQLHNILHQHIERTDDPEVYFN